MKTQLPKAAYNLTGAAGRLVCCRSNYKVGGGRDREAQGLSLNLLGCSPAPTPATSPMELPSASAQGPPCCFPQHRPLPPARGSGFGSPALLDYGGRKKRCRTQETGPGKLRAGDHAALSAAGPLFILPQLHPESPAHHLHSVMGGLAVLSRLKVRARGLRVTHLHSRNHLFPPSILLT